MDNSDHIQFINGQLNEYNRSLQEEIQDLHAADREAATRIQDLGDEMPFEEPTEAPKTKMLIFESRTGTFSIRFRTCGQKMSSFVETTTGFMTTFITFASSYDMLLALKAMPIIFASSSEMLPMLLATTVFLVSSLKT